MGRFLDAIASTKEYAYALELYKKGLKAVSVTGLSDSAKAHFASAFLKDTGKNMLYITPSESEAKTLAEDLRFFLKEDASVVYFPLKDYVFYNVEAMNQDVIFDRICAICTLYTSDKPVIVVTGANASQQYTLPKELFGFIEFKEGKVFDLKKLAEQMNFMGYLRSENVEGPGQYSLRGGILDIFSPGELYPTRIEFFDDEVDTLRMFDPASQLSVKKVEKAILRPCRELIYSKESVNGFVGKIKKNAQDNENILGDIERFENRHYFSSAEKYLPYIYTEITTICDYFDDGIIFYDNLPRIKDRAQMYLQEITEEITSIADKDMVVLPKKHTFVKGFDSLTDRGIFKVAIEGLTSHENLMKSNAVISFSMRSMQSYLGKAELILEDIKYWIDSGYGVTVVVGSKTKAEAFAKTLQDAGYIPVISNEDKIPQKKQILITVGTLSRGYELPLSKYVIVGDKELFGGERTQRRVRKMQGNRIKSYNDLEVGDFIVHHIHGIGKYLGIHRMEVDGIKKDYLKLLYRDNDILYIPATALHLINKYVSGENGNVRLNKMGGAEFSRVKGKVKKSVEEMAQKLVALYAKRLEAKGYAFCQDSDWQKSFEEEFPYEETEDQLRCINEVKRDMESEKPMDRLLCGDVGFGKTEIALRAAFKAVMDGKQVAYLVPTTVLARQHYSTFLNRMSRFPIKVEMMSRFRTPKRQKEIAKELSDGRIDVVIGTHRILGKDIKFKDLGLLIIDEEQRFGVGDKEKIKELKANIDVLTLSATPIPRTMHMAMIGIRDMSVINEPPSNRYPVQTYVMEYNRDVIKDAILKELDRGGQIYYVYNRVEGIEKVAMEIQSVAPNARVAVGHGKMSEKQLEDIMISAMEGEIDILVCTTIIETGLDIPNINTIIIENADCMGLSQLYQLRGRVGRSNRRAYAYLTYRKNKQINETADKRLKSIKEFTEFGSGFKIALRDLEIRGAGNVLGPEQHGVMDAVGYDMYCKILSEAVTLAKGEPVKEEIITSIDLKVDAFIPDSYIDSANTRIEMYKRISCVETSDDVSEITDELIDRFGDPPEAVTNLINIAHISKLSAKALIKDISQKGDFVSFYCTFSCEADKIRINKLCALFPQRLMFIQDKKPHIIMRVTEKTTDGLFSNIKIVLRRYIELQNEEL